ncbi:MAG: monofunctional biosynthetic peptidoglycan transglycosylase [Pseudomonadota bacterium]
MSTSILPNLVPSNSTATSTANQPQVVNKYHWLFSWLFKVLLYSMMGIILIQCWFFLHIVWWKWFSVNNTAFMNADLVVLQIKNPDAHINYIWVDYADINKSIKQAVISSEDAEFEDHEGVDWAAIELARETNSKRGKIVSGGSTITMQLAKNLFLSGSRSYLRKAQELVITYMLELVLSKQRILEMYLNIAEFGIGIYGVEAGAKHHFGIQAKQLSAEQAARMAAMLPRPKFYDKHRNSTYLKKRTRIIMKRMQGVQIP